MSENINSVEAMIKNIVTVVFRIHFYYVTNIDLEQDLKQEGYLKAYELLANGNYDPNKNLRTFIYTGVRNAMTNYMYHDRKENHSDIEDMTGPEKYNPNLTLDDYWKGKMFYTDEDNMGYDYDIDLDIVYEVCNKYLMFGDYTDLILNELSKVGIYNGPILKTNIKSLPFIKNAILGEIYWNIFKEK